MTIYLMPLFYSTTQWLVTLDQGLLTQLERLTATKKRSVVTSSVYLFIYLSVCLFIKLICVHYSYSISMLLSLH